MNQSTLSNPLSLSKKLGILILLSFMASHSAWAQSDNLSTSSKPAITASEQEILDLSKQKWLWMADKKIEPLDALFHEKAVFVHMSRTMSKQQELDVIKSGGIHYKKADIHEASVNIIGNTAICLNKITLLAVVGGKVVTNPFVVTEVYVKDGKNWEVASLSFTRLVTQ